MRWQQKPILGTPIDSAHPLYPGLACAWTLNEGFGNTWVNAASPGTYDATRAGTSGSWGFGTSGLAWQSPGANANYWSAGQIAALNGATQATLVYRFGLATPSSLAASGRDNGAADRFFLLQRSTDANAFCGPAKAVIPTLAVGDHTMAMVFDGTATGNSGRLKFYVDGLITSPAYTGTVPSALATNTIPFTTGGLPQSSINGTSREDWVALWIGRALTAADIAALHWMPWDLYRPAPGWTEAEAQLYYAPAGRPIIRGGSPNLGPCIFTSPMIGCW